MTDRPCITERYASSVRSSNLGSRPDTYRSDSDVLGAAGLAARPNGVTNRPGNPLAISLQRFFGGDDREGKHLVALLAQMAWGKARDVRLKLYRHEADELGRACLAWFRHRACPDCGGHGFRTVGGEIGSGRAVLSDEHCPACKGTGRRPFEETIRPGHRTIAVWLVAQVQREESAAGAAISACVD